MNAIKKSIAIILTICLIMPTAICAVAAEKDEGQILIAANNGQEATEPAGTVLTGIVKDITASGDMFNVTITATEYNNEDVVLKVFEDTAIIDNETKLYMTVSDLTIGEAIAAYVSSAITLSIPPQTNAHAIVANIKRDVPVAKYMTVAEVQKVSENSVRFLDEDGMYLITISEDTVLMPYKTKQNVVVDSIMPGNRVFVWFAIITMSIPGQVTAEHLVLLPPIEETAEVPPQNKPFVTELKENGGILNEDNFDKASVNGKVVELTGSPLLTKNGEIMVPIRVICNALGLDVGWHADKKAVAVKKGDETYGMSIGVDGYGRESDLALAKLGIEPVLIGGVTYVPAIFFDLIYENNDVTKVVDGMLTVNTK